MTRNEIEQVEKHFDELHAIATGITPNIPDDITQALKAAYIAGADYAVDMFAPRWISVEDYATDELPPLIDEKDPYGESVHVLFVVELDGIQFISKGCFDYDSGMWHALETDCSYCKEQVTHWMPIPQPPSSSGIPNNHKKGECMEIFKLLERLESENAATCRGCKHRQRFELNEHSTKVVQCCDLQPSNRSNSGYKTIKVTDKACSFYEPKKGGEK